jgi:hypothetical protein
MRPSLVSESKPSVMSSSLEQADNYEIFFGDDTGQGITEEERELIQ